MEPTGTDLQVVLWAVIVASVVFIADLMLPLAVYVGVLYAGVVLLSLWDSHRHTGVVMAIGASVLIGIGFFKSPGAELLGTAAANRLVAITVVWETAILLLLYRRWSARTQETRAHLAGIVECSHDAIISKTLEGTVVSWNQGAERIFGYRAEEVMGQKIAALVPADLLDQEPQIVERLRRGKPMDTFETVRCRKDGQAISVSLTLSPIMDAQGRVIGISKIARDISARKKDDEERNNVLLSLIHAMDQIKTLRGMLPMCASCHKIRNDEGYWDRLEKYFQEHSELTFTHGLCPDCVKHLYPTLTEPAS
jgi:PAS domain S-box-containing protein